MSIDDIIELAKSKPWMTFTATVGGYDGRFVTPARRQKTMVLLNVKDINGNKIADKTFVNITKDIKKKSLYTGDKILFDAKLDVYDRHTKYEGMYGYTSSYFYTIGRVKNIKILYNPVERLESED